MLGHLTLHAPQNAHSIFVPGGMYGMERSTIAPRTMEWKMYKSLPRTQYISKALENSKSFAHGNASAATQMHMVMPIGPSIMAWCC